MISNTLFFSFIIDYVEMEIQKLFEIIVKEK